jgi:hypothetical protein
MRREIARFQETRAVVQALRDEDGEASRKSFQDYRHALMPFLEEEEKQEERRLIQHLQDEVSKGGLRVQPLMPTTPVISQLRKQVNIKDPTKPGYRRTKRW